MMRTNSDRPAPTGKEAAVIAALMFVISLAILLLPLSNK